MTIGVAPDTRIVSRWLPSRLRRLPEFLPRGVPTGAAPPARRPPRRGGRAGDRRAVRERILLPPVGRATGGGRAAARGGRQRGVPDPHPRGAGGGADGGRGRSAAGGRLPPAVPGRLVRPGLVRPEPHQLGCRDGGAGVPPPGRAGRAVAILEVDEFHHVLLPWPVELEAVLPQAVLAACLRRYGDGAKLSPRDGCGRSSSAAASARCGG